MTMLSRLREKRTGSLATAIHAISATQPKGNAATVARIATVAVASPTSEKTAPPAKVGAGDTATASRWWLIHYPDRDPVEVACCPEATHADILERHPGAVAAEPFAPTIRQPSAPLTASEETAIRAWLALIEETDPATIAEVIGQCRRDADARDYFTGRAAAELPKPVPFPDDRRCCTQCLNLRGWVCGVATPGGLVSANRGYRPAPDTLQRCAGYLPNGSDKDQRAGRERWPGLTD
ncbi:MAG: hypothetical protein JNL84_03740 [Candidatus Accumulibacter sp.]|nr:hypothetical protein [Accumulibacter sp.]